MSNQRPVQKFADGNICFWIEQDSTIMLKAVTSFGDPVELGVEEIRESGEALITMANKLEEIDSPKQ